MPDSQPQGNVVDLGEEGSEEEEEEDGDDD